MEDKIKVNKWITFSTEHLRLNVLVHNDKITDTGFLEILDGKNTIDTGWDNIEYFRNLMPEDVIECEREQPILSKFAFEKEIDALIQELDRFDKALFGFKRDVRYIFEKIDELRK